MPKEGERMVKSKGAIFGLGLLFLLMYGMGAVLQSTPFIGQWVSLILAIVLGAVGLLGLFFGVAYKKIPSMNFFGEVGKFLIFLTGPWRLLEVILVALGVTIPMLSLISVVVGITFLAIDWIVALL